MYFRIHTRSIRQMASFLSILLSWNGDSLVHTFAVVIVNGPRNTNRSGMFLFTLTRCPVNAILPPFYIV